MQKKQRIEELKAQGLYKTKEQIEKERVAEERRKAILAQKGITEEEADDGQEKKISYKNKNKNKKKRGAAAQQEEVKEQPEQTKQESEQEDEEEEDNRGKQKTKTKEQPKSFEIDVDDWENDDALDKALNAMPTQDTQATIAAMEASSGEEEEAKQSAGAKK